MADNAKEPIDSNGLRTGTSGETLRSALDSHRESIMDRYGLSAREREVVNAILEGETRASAAERLFISERTVKFHLENCYKKMNVGGKNELIRLFAVEAAKAE